MSGPTSTTTSTIWERCSDWITTSPVGQSLDVLGFQDHLDTKAARIEACLSRGSSVDLWELRELALSRGGLLTPSFRKRAWPLLLGILPEESSQQIRGPSSKIGRRNSSGRPSPSILAAALSDSTNLLNNKKNTEEKKTEHDANLDLIQRDVGRSVVFRYKNNNNGSKASATSSYASDRLASALENTIRMTPQGHTNDTSPEQSSSSESLAAFHYYQGLHDVAGAILHQLDYDAELGTQILQKLAQSHWRDAMRENFGNLTWILNHLFLPLVEKVDLQVHMQLQAAQAEISNLVLPWMITWMTHDIFDSETAGRMVDACLASHPLFSMYLSVALLTQKRIQKELLLMDVNDTASIFVFLKQLPKHIVSDACPKKRGFSKVTVQELIDDALEILYNYPPRSLLELVRPEIMSPGEVLQRCSSIHVFQAVRPWNVESCFCIRPASSSQSPLSSTSSTSLSPILGLFSQVYTRSKVASGVPLLMHSVGGWTWWLHSQRRLFLRIEARSKPKRVLQKLRRMLWGKQTAK